MLDSSICIADILYACSLTSWMAGESIGGIMHSCGKRVEISPIVVVTEWLTTRLCGLTFLREHETL